MTLIAQCILQFSINGHIVPKYQPRNVTHSLISRNPREWMFVVQMSLLIVTFVFLSKITVLLLMQTTKEVNLHPHIAPRVNMWSVLFFFFFCCCHLLNYWCLDLSHCPGRSSGKKVGWAEARLKWMRSQTLIT